jgi:integrase/recombinase XerD
MRGCLPLTRDEVLAVAGCMRGACASRNRALFRLGVNTGFRISELLSLTVGDVLLPTGELAERVTVQRGSMKGKRESRTVRLNQRAREALMPWLAELAERGFIHRDDPLFPSLRTKENLGRTQGWRVVHDACRAAGHHGRLGSHTMRKTFANNIYQELLARLAMGEPVDPFRSTSKLLGHKDIKSTDQYLSFREADLDGVLDRAGV